MKHSAKKYAIALAGVISEKKVDSKKVTSNFLALLEKNQDMKKASEIIKMTEILMLKKSGNKKIIIEIARKTDTNELIKVFAKKGDVIEERINPALVAGVKIMVNGAHQLDNSLAAKLNRI